MLAAQDLETEALTMRLIRRETSVPLPEVYAYETSPDENELQCAFILMEYVVGVPVIQVWFDASACPKTFESRRRRCLQDLANATIQLNRLQFSRAGSPVFSEDGSNIVEIGPSRRRIGQDEDKICEWGPWADTRSYLRRSLDRDLPTYMLGRASYKLLDLFIDWLVASTSSTSSSPSQTFVLCHPDFNPLNILVSEVDGSLQAIIDWNGTESVPRILGNEGYPLWLTRDWDPCLYSYPVEPNSQRCPEDSPSELARYRDVYIECIERARATDRFSRAYDPTPASDITALTRSSLLVQNLFIAADSYYFTGGIVHKIFDLIKERDVIRSQTEGIHRERDDFHFCELVPALDQGELDDEGTMRLRLGFESLLSP